jgi:hypothetical protein
MAMCDICRRNMSEGLSCTLNPLIIYGKPYEPIRCGDERRPMFSIVPCGDCAVERGGVHHHGCDLEQCPACKGQLLSCGCMTDDDFKFADGIFGDGLSGDGHRSGAETDPDYGYVGRKRTLCDFIEPPRKCGAHGRDGSEGPGDANF